MRSFFFCVAAVHQEDNRRRQPTLKGSRMPDRTPETKGIAETNAISRAQARAGVQGAWMGRGERGVQVCPLLQAPCSVQDRFAGCDRHGARRLQELRQPGQQVCEQHDHLALIRREAMGGCPGGVFRIQCFRASAHPAGGWPLSVHDLQSASLAAGGIDLLARLGGCWTKLPSSGIHFHSNQPLTAKSQ